MNLLQSIDEKVHGPVLVTLNPPFEPAADKIAGEWSYDHPLYTEKVHSSLSPSSFLIFRYPYISSTSHLSNDRINSRSPLKP